MNGPSHEPQAVAVMHEPTAHVDILPGSDGTQTNQCRQRAAVAARLIGGGAVALTDVDWQALDRAPHWLGFSDDALALLQNRLGAMLRGAEIRHWIDQPRLSAARRAVGEMSLQSLCGGPALPATGIEPEPLNSAQDVPEGLRCCGAALLLATIAPGPLQDAAIAALQVSPTAIPQVNASLVQEMISRVGS